ncbi:uncharacterized protein TNCV_4360331 [Trichonephila clavipes]|uniref:Uncharacterized protein n=1 Tax=Trichonephila clavipes TaxID=2585209 RepID=A0A8X7BGT4_TRICX|nr:uncharacterized protein TNCV_4360331 [Trichonephila clavipes]
MRSQEWTMITRECCFRIVENGGFSPDILKNRMVMIKTDLCCTGNYSAGTTHAMCRLLVRDTVFPEVVDNGKTFTRAKTKRRENLFRTKTGKERTEVGVCSGNGERGIPTKMMVAEWYRYRTVACFVTGSSPVPLKTRRVGQRCTLNLSRAETSSRWCGVVVRRGVCQLRCRPRHLTMVQNYVVRRQKPSCS